MSIVDRYIDGYPGTKQPTVLVTASWTPTSAESWPKIVSQLKKYADGLTNNPTWRHVDIAVEMLAPELIMQKYLAPVVGNERLSKDWPYISRMVLSLLEFFTQTKSRTMNISLFHLGYSPAADKNPITVYISVDYECLEESWPPVLRRIQDELNKGPHKLVAFIEHGEANSLNLLPASKHSSWTDVVASPLETQAAIPSIDADWSRPVGQHLRRGNIQPARRHTGLLSRNRARRSRVEEAWPNQLSRCAPSVRRIPGQGCPNVGEPGRNERQGSTDARILPRQVRQRGLWAR